jgi:hypothetical protein
LSSIAKRASPKFILVISSKKVTENGQIEKLYLLILFEDDMKSLVELWAISLNGVPGMGTNVEV